MDLSDVGEIKKAVTAVNEAFEAFKKANDERIKQIEDKGAANSDVMVKVDKANEDITRLQAELEEVAKKANRPAAPGKDDESPESVEHKAAWNTWMRSGKGENELAGLERKAMSSSNDLEGGFLVPETVEAGFDAMLRADVAMRSLARVVPINGPTYKRAVQTGGAAGGWTDSTETDPAGETAPPKVVPLEFNVEKQWAEPHAFNDLLEDSIIDIDRWLQDECQETFSELEGAAFIKGDGNKKPMGFLSYPTIDNANYSWGNLGFVKTGVNGGFQAKNLDPADCLINLVHSLKSGYRNGASFLMNDLTFAAVRKLKDVNGNYLWRPGLADGPQSTLLAYPVSTDDFMPDMATGSFSIAFGNWKRGYLIVDRRGIIVIRDNLTTKGRTKFHTTRRVGGGVQNFAAIKLLQFSA